MEDSASDIVVGKLIVYKMRWYVVLVLWWLNVTNGVLWISYANISDKTAEFYAISVASVNWFSLVFPLVTIIFGMPSIWALDRMGIRISFNVCALLNLTSATLRLLCAYETVAVNKKFIFAMTGQTLASFAQPIAMFSPARIASVWFAPEQRTTATTLSALGNPLGILLGSFLPPIILQYSRGFTNLALFIFAHALIGALLSCLGICHSTPARPPAISCDRPTRSSTFLSQVFFCVKNRQFIILSIVFGIAVAIFSTLSTLMEQILCPFGYSSDFAGLCGSLMIACGIVGAYFSGILADKTKALAEIVQICFVLSSFGLIAFSTVSVFPAQNGVIIASVCWIGTFGIAMYSIAIELAAEATFPASENISTGLLVIAGQVFTVLFILLSLVLHQTVGDSIQVPNLCHFSSNQSYWRLNITMSCCAALSSAVLLFAFYATYRRRSTDAALISAQEDYDRDLLISTSE